MNVLEHFMLTLIRLSAAIIDAFKCCSSALRLSVFAWSRVLTVCSPLPVKHQFLTPLFSGSRFLYIYFHFKSLFASSSHLPVPHRRSLIPPLIPDMAASLSQLSACVTRILALTGFPKELKTRDIQAAFSEWENASGGFKIKWIDDTSLLIVFADATVGMYRNQFMFFLLLL